MSYVPHKINPPLAGIVHLWDSCKAAYNRALVNYYNQRIEKYPEAEAYQYWFDTGHLKPEARLENISDAHLSQLAKGLVQQGISRLAADCFVLELRKIRRENGG